MCFLHLRTFSCKDYFCMQSWFFLTPCCAHVLSHIKSRTVKQIQKLAICFLYGLAVPGALAIW